MKTSPQERCCENNANGMIKDGKCACKCHHPEYEKSENEKLIERGMNMIKDNLQSSSKIVYHPAPASTWEERFDELMPLEWFATENYHGKSEELEFARWTKQETNRAKGRRDLFIKFCFSLLLEEREKLAIKVQCINTTDKSGNDILIEAAVLIRKGNDS